MGSKTFNYPSLSRHLHGKKASVLGPKLTVFSFHFYETDDTWFVYVTVYCVFDIYEFPKNLGYYVHVLPGYSFMG